MKIIKIGTPQVINLITVYNINHYCRQYWIKNWYIYASKKCLQSVCILTALDEELEADNEDSKVSCISDKFFLINFLHPSDLPPQISSKILYDFFCDVLSNDCYKRKWEKNQRIVYVHL